MKCPLCKFSSPAMILEHKEMKYWHCQECDLRFLDKECYLSLEEETERYLAHENQIHDDGYQKYVEPLVDQIRTRLEPGFIGLDYGCGDGPVVTYLLEKLGYQISLYDLVFQPDKSVLDKKYEFIILSETAEHFHFPDREFSSLSALTKPGGFLFVMTKFYDEHIDFKNWHYRRDPTHVCFYSRKTFKWIAKKYGFKEPEFSSDRVLVFTKNGSDGQS